MLYQLLHVYLQFYLVSHYVLSSAKLLIITADGINGHFMYIYATDPLLLVR